MSAWVAYFEKTPTFSQASYVTAADIFRRELFVCLWLVGFGRSTINIA